MPAAAFAGTTHGFARDARLLQGEDFKNALRGRRSRGRWILVASRPGDSARSRLGIIVGRQVVRSAVERNRIKRTVREIFRTLDAQRSLDVVVRIHCQPQKGDRPALRAELQQMLSRLLC